MDIIEFIKLAFKIVFYGIAVIMSLGVIAISGDLLSHKKFGLFLVAATLSAIITLLLESWLHGGTWWMIVAFSTAFFSIGSIDDPDTGNDSDREETGLDAGDKFLLTLWIASLFENRDR